MKGFVARVDPLGALLVAIGGGAVLFMTFAIHKANRIAAGEHLSLWHALPSGEGVLLLALLIVVGLVALSARRAFLRLAAASAGLFALVLAIGAAASRLIPTGDTLSRVAPGGGFWLLLVALALLLTDSLLRLRLSPLGRVMALAAAIAAGAGLLLSGWLDDVSVLREYAVRADQFWQEAGKHVALALGAVAAATVIGLPLGLLCHRASHLRAAFLQFLGLIQTIPSIALFGILMTPLGFIAAHLPIAAALGVRGIGMAPAFVALFLYALLPVVANTVAGLAAVPVAVHDSARGMGMTAGQILAAIELPLAFPVLLTGIRIVLVQSLGLATVAALIGGGGFGTFVFQGVGQTAMDLVLLGALPTVSLAFAAAILLDAAAAGLRRGRT